LADAVLLAVSQRLAPRFVAKPGASTGLVLQAQGMNLERYAELLRLLEPFGGRLKAVEADRVDFEVAGNAEQVRAQLALGKLQEIPAAEAAAAAQSTAAPAQPAPVDAAAQPSAPSPAPMIVPAAAPQMYFRW
jgi:hypothetical protein